MFEQGISLGPGTGTFTQHTFEIFIMLLVAFILGLWLGWAMWSRYKEMVDQLRLDNTSLSASVASLRAELDATKSRLATAEGDLNSFRLGNEGLKAEMGINREKLAASDDLLAQTMARNRQLETELALSLGQNYGQDVPLEIAQPEPGLAFAEPVAEPEIQYAVPPPPAEADPALNLNIADTHSVAERTGAMLPPDQHTTIRVVDGNTEQTVTVTLDSPQPNVEIRLENPSAAAIEPAPPMFAPIPDSPTDSYFPAAETDGANDFTPPDLLVLPPLGPRDDLKIVEGIGPRIEELLNQYGIRTYFQLAETTPLRLKEILQGAGPQLGMHDPGTWPTQASLAANEQWDNLRAYQYFLKSGKFQGK